MTEELKSVKNFLILVADDDRGSRLMLRHFLEEIGHTVIEAVDGAEALSRIDVGVD